MKNPRLVLHFAIGVCLVLFLGGLFSLFKSAHYGTVGTDAFHFQNSFKEVFVYIPKAKQWEQLEFESQAAFADDKVRSQLSSKYGFNAQSPLKYSELFKDEFRLKWVIPKKEYAHLKNPSLSFYGFFERNRPASVTINGKPSYEFQRFQDPYFLALLDATLELNTVEIVYGGLSPEQPDFLISLNRFGVQIVEYRDALSLVINFYTEMDQLRLILLGVLCLSVLLIFILYMRRTVGLEYGYHTVLMLVIGAYYIFDMRKSIMYFSRFGPEFHRQVLSYFLLAIGSWLIAFTLSFFRIRNIIEMRLFNGKRFSIHTDYFYIFLASTLPFLVIALMQHGLHYSAYTICLKSENALFLMECIALALSLYLFRQRLKAAKVDPIQKNRTFQCLIFTVAIGLTTLTFSITNYIQSTTQTLSFLADLSPILGFCLTLVLDYSRSTRLLEAADMQQNPIDILARTVGASAIPKNKMLGVATFDLINYSESLFKRLIRPYEGFALFHQKTLSLYFLALRALHYDSLEFGGDKITAFFVTRPQGQKFSREHPSQILLDALMFIKFVHEINQKLISVSDQLITYYGLNLPHGQCLYNIRSACDARVADEIWLDPFTNVVKFLGDPIHVPARFENYADAGQIALEPGALERLFRDSSHLRSKWEPKVQVKTPQQLKGISFEVREIKVLSLSDLSWEDDPECRLRYQAIARELDQCVAQIEEEMQLQFPVKRQQRAA